MDIPLMTLLLALSLNWLGLAAALNVSIDNTSPQVIFSPTPCFEQDIDGCSDEWLLLEIIDSFNGSVTTTTGPQSSMGLDLLPRASLSFQGSFVLFMPGLHSTAQASVAVDDLPSVLVNTSLNAFQGTGLDPAKDHVITITFVPSDVPTTLDVDYFLIVQPDNNGTIPTTSSLFPAPLPTSLPPTSAPSTPMSTSTPTSTSTSTTSSSSSPASTPLSASSQTVPTGTIAAVSLSGALVLVLTLICCLLYARRRRHRAAVRRESAILGDLRLPSEGGSKVAERGKSSEDDGAFRTREKGKGRETAWNVRRDSILPPVHYTPWR